MGIFQSTPCVYWVNMTYDWGHNLNAHYMKLDDAVKCIEAELDMLNETARRRVAFTARITMETADRKFADMIPPIYEIHLPNGRNYYSFDKNPFPGDPEGTFGTVLIQEPVNWKV